MKPSSVRIGLSLLLFSTPHHAIAIAMNPTSKASVFPEAQHFVSREHAQHEFSSSVPPVVRVDPGDLVHVQTNDCYHGRVQPNTLSQWTKERANRLHESQEQHEENQQQSSSSSSSGGGGGSFLNGSILHDIPRSAFNPITGPIYVNGARPGDVLAVTLLDIRTRGIGIACCGSHSGQLSGWMKADSTTIKFFDMSRCGTILTMRDFGSEDTTEGVAPSPPKVPHHHRRLGPISFPASPSLGVIGVAPALEDDPIGTMPAGKHGGNLDNRSNRVGSTVYLPVNHPGALLSIGDMHASQGDGEIAGTGVEIGGDVLLRCRVLKQEDLYGDDSSDGDSGSDSDWELEYPVTETETHWITHGVTVCDIPETTSIACKEAAKILVGQWGFTLEESFIFLSVNGDLGTCQACHPDVGTQIAKMSVPKLENVCPGAFRVLSSPSQSP
mmetsp:Transcript_833/g.2079  ORF Transcript_833/g.2079 Transcript_833/m.2079 type:complete len:441 (-) Transcript_833:1472-2794(-)